MKSRGYSLPEAMLSLFLIALAMLAVLGVYVASLPMMAQNREVATASSLARSLHEQILATGAVPLVARTFRGQVPDAPLAGFPPAPYPSQVVENVPYTYQVTTTPVAGRSDVVTVEVEVRWKPDRRLTQQALYYVR